MGINIWLPIVVNVLVLGIMVAGAIIGKKNGFLYELLKLVVLCGCGVGIYFLNPIVVNLIIQIPFINNFITQGLCTIELVKAFSFVILFITTDIIVTIIFKIVKHCKNKNRVKTVFVNTAKPAKIQGINKKETRRLNKEQKKINKQNKKLNKKPLSTKQKVFGVIFGLIVSFVFGFVITLPLKPIFTKIAEVQPEIAEVEKGYEYTAYGQIDKITNIVEIIIGEN